MRGFLIFLLIVGLGFVFLRQKQREKQALPVAKPTIAATQAGLQPQPVLTPAPRGQASEYNYMKRALDRAADARDQARAQSKAGQDP